MAGAPVGNANGAKQKRLLADCLKRELTQRPQDILAIANKLIESAKAGEAWAMTLIHERVDGKLPQPLVGGDDDDDAPIRHSHLVEFVNGASATPGKT
jgi:hypothetical protein